MKKLYTLLYMVGCTSFLYAQNPEEGTFLVKEKNAERVGADLVITLKADISSLEVSRNQSLVCTPLVERESPPHPLRTHGTGRQRRIGN